jgi:ATP/maltotriose-dependent transcriptional regulator MalT
MSMLAAQIRARGGRSKVALTKREREILGLIAEGRSAAQVGGELALSTSTVKTHLTHIYEKLDVSGAPAAVHEAMRLGILS